MMRIDAHSAVRKSEILGSTDIWKDDVEDVRSYLAGQLLCYYESLRALIRRSVSLIDCDIWAVHGLSLPVMCIKFGDGPRDF